VEGVRDAIVGEVGKRTLVFLGITDLPSSLHQVLLIDIVPVCVHNQHRNVTFV
jgi:hypothetical protein